MTCQNVTTFHFLLVVEGQKIARGFVMTMRIEWQYCMSLASIDEKLFAFYALETFANNFLSIDARDMKIPPFDAHRHDESNEP